MNLAEWRAVNLNLYYDWAAYSAWTHFDIPPKKWVWVQTVSLTPRRPTFSSPHNKLTQLSDNSSLDIIESRHVCNIFSVSSVAQGKKVGYSCAKTFRFLPYSNFYDLRPRLVDVALNLYLIPPSPPLQSERIRLNESLDWWITNPHNSLSPTPHNAYHSSQINKTQGLALKGPKESMNSICNKRL